MQACMYVCDTKLLDVRECIYSHSSVQIIDIPNS